MSNKHRNQQVHSGAAGQQPVRPVSVPAQEPPPVPVEARESAKPGNPAPVPPPPPPAWQGRIAEVNARLDDRYTILPDTWLSQRMRKQVMTARELQRLGFDPRRFVNLGLIAKV